MSGFRKAMKELLATVCALAATNVVIAEFGPIGVAYAVPIFALMRILILLERIATSRK
jgi:hypothetical protein